MGYEMMRQPIHLGLGATAIREPDFTGELAWYDAYAARHPADGKEGRLVSMHRFSEAWQVWEMHPEGDEVVLCTAGELELLQEVEGRVVQTTLRAGQYAINPAGVWHTADVASTATAVFITAGLDTQHRAR